MNRRGFIKTCIATGISFPMLNQSTFASLSNESYSKKTLILIELQGGNDGLNTVIPFSDPLYYILRPTIAIKENEFITLNKQLALHHSLEALMPIWEAQNCKIVLGVGYEDPNLSHFRSIEIWDTASKSNDYLEKGWLAKTLNQREAKINALVLGGTFGPLNGADKTIQIRNINQFLKRSNLNTLQNEHSNDDNSALLKLLKTQKIIDDAAQELKVKLKPLDAPTPFGKHAFLRQMAIATQVIQSDLNIPVIKLRLSGFDTHANQKPRQARLLKTLSQAINRCQQALDSSGHWQKTTLMSYSEFGRRAVENGSKGTDHGTAAPHFIIGGSVEGGFLGTQPSLAKLEKNNLQYTTDFKKLYEAAYSY